MPHEIAPSIGEDISSALHADLPLTTLTVGQGLLYAGLFLGGAYVIAKSIGAVRNKIGETLRL